MKFNPIYLITTSLNGGVEVAVSPKMSIDVNATYNKWGMSSRQQLHLFLLQPELRYWFKRSTEGCFVGLHATWGQYNVHGLYSFGMGNRFKYQGDVYGGGFTVGHQWRVSRHLYTEIYAGLGYAHLVYDRYYRPCGILEGSHRLNYVGPTKAGISLIYAIR